METLWEFNTEKRELTGLGKARAQNISSHTKKRDLSLLLQGTEYQTTRRNYRI
jgi:hypothetical protein